MPSTPQRFITDKYIHAQNLQRQDEIIINVPNKKKKEKETEKRKNNMK